MTSVNNNEYLSQHRRFRMNNKKSIVIAAISAVLVFVMVFWWLKLVGITVTGDALCGLDEHIHSEQCYTVQFICSYTSDAASVTDAAVTQADADAENQTDIQSDAEEQTEKISHIHTEECTVKTLVCFYPEHTHSSECFPDNSVDTETPADWKQTFSEVELTNDVAANLIEIAMTQKGYAESTRNYKFDEMGIKRGYTRYGEWYGNPYARWNTLFVAFCINYANINNSDELEAAEAENMRLAWQARTVYSSAEGYTPVRGEVVFFDTDSDGKADRTGICVSSGDEKLLVIEGDKDGKVDVVEYSDLLCVMGYGRTGELYSATHITEEESSEEISSEEESSEEILSELSEEEMMLQSATPLLMFSNAPQHNITYIEDLTLALSNVVIKTENGEVLGDGSTVYIGQSYIVALEFKEDNTGEEWIQFRHNEYDHFLHYQIPEYLHCEPFDSWHPITALTENGTIEDVGEYFVDEHGYLRVRFYDDENGVCFGSKYSNVDFTIEFNAFVGDTQSDSTTEIEFGNEINVNLNIDGGAAMNVTKTHGQYDSDNHTMEYTIRVEATKGVVRELVIDDQIWDTHYTLRDTIVVTDLNGNVLDPQPVVSNHPAHNNGAEEGFRLSEFPDFSAGNGFLITYKTQLYDNMLSEDNVALWNGLDSTGKDSNGNDVYVWAYDWLNVELEKIEKDGRQAALEGADGNTVPVIEWEVDIKKDNHNLHGTVIIDTLGEGLSYYTGKDIRVKCYDEWGNRLEDVYIGWDEVSINGNSMEFALPDGYSFEIIYYSEYEELAEGELKNYTNSVSAVINGKQETAGGDADVVGFIPRVSKSAAGNDGEYVYFTIEADVPAVIKDWGNFYLTDLAAFWGYDNAEGYLYVENVPEDITITAVTESGRTIDFAPYNAGGTTENTFILIYPAEGDQYHSFNILFNTADTEFASSKWILNEDAVLTITYKLPFDSKTGVEWEGELSGDKTLEDVLLEDKKFANEVYFNYTDVIQGTASSIYEYSPFITKDSVVNEDGTIDYTVVFRNTIPGTYGDGGYLNAGTTMAYFNDSFDEKLEYVQGSLSVICYDPWRDGLWMNKYLYEGQVTGNTMNIPADQFIFTETNPDAAAVGWSNLHKRTDLDKFYKWVNAGGDYVFSYTLKVKDEYLYSTEQNTLVFDNTAEMTWDTDGSSGPVTEQIEYQTGLLDKHVVQENNKLKFDIHVNRNALDILPGTDKLIIEDTMTHSLSVYWDTIKLYYEAADGSWIDFDSAQSIHKFTVSYDQASNKLTFTVPDELHIRIDYTTLITESGFVSVNNSVKIDGRAQVSDIIDAIFKVEEHSGGASGSTHNITLLKQNGETGEPLSDVMFHFYGPMSDITSVPEGVAGSIVTDKNKTLYYIGTYTTGADGTVVIDSQFLTLGGPYALVEATVPEGFLLPDEPTYFYFYDNNDSDGEIQTVTTIIAVENYQYGFVLPETGGTGILPLAIIGFALTASPILYIIIRRKRERRLL